MRGYFKNRRSNFIIKAADKNSALDELQLWIRCLNAKGNSLNNIPIEDTLENQLYALSWESDVASNNDIVDIWYDDGAGADENEWMDVIAPFVLPGSYVEIEDEDGGAIWCWYFNGTHCVRYDAKIIYPDMPRIFRRNMGLEE